jgi:putative heme-binding domain-containing protein
MKVIVPAGMIVLAAAVVAAATAHAQEAVKPVPRGVSQPNPDPGARLFQNACKVCHGEAAVGGVAPALVGSKFTAAFVQQVVADGRPGTMMPGFRQTLTPNEIAHVSGYVEAIQGRFAGAGILRGDPAAGEASFFARGAHSCRGCHSFKGRGGKVGPDLATKLAGDTAREIFRKIVVVPHRSSDPAYVTTRLTLTTGEVLTGIRAGETADAVRFYDTSSLPPTLRTIPKADVTASARHAASVMPNDYASRLSLKQLLDIVAFLRSAQPGAPPVTIADIMGQPLH